MPYWAQPPYGSCTDATAFQIMSVEPRDASFFASIKGFQAQNPSLKSFILSIGGEYANTPDPHTRPPARH